MYWFRRKEELALDAAVRAVGKVATALLVEGSDPDGVVFSSTATYFGGNPYFEAGETWPTFPHNARPYDFVCQVNLADCPARPNVPFDLFTVFVCWAALESGDSEHEPCLVRTYRDVSADKMVHISRPPPNDPEDYRVRPCVVRMETFMTYPWSMKKFPAIIAAASRFRNPNAAYSASLKRLGFWNNYDSRVGGFPTWVHDNTLEEDDLVFLAQIDYEPDANNCIGDAAPIYIAVCASDPTRIEIDPFQSF